MLKKVLVGILLTDDTVSVAKSNLKGIYLIDIFFIYMVSKRGRPHYLLDI